MSNISRNKITVEDVASNGVQSQANQLQGTASENKFVFDKLVNDVVKVRLNALIDDLMSVVSGYGADSIGSPIIADVNGTTVQAKLQDLKNQIDGVVLGAIPDGSITNTKFTTEAVPTNPISGYTMPAFTTSLVDTDQLIVALGKLERAIANLSAEGAITAFKFSH